MRIKLFPLKYFEDRYGEVKAVHNFYRLVQEAFEVEEISPIFHVLEVIVLFAPESEYEEGKWKEIQEFSWKYGIGTISIRGNYEKFLFCDEKEKVNEIYNLLLCACDRLAKKRKAKFDIPKMKRLLGMAYDQYLEKNGDAKKNPLSEH